MPSEIEKISREKNIGYMESVIYWCEENGLDPEFAGELIKKNLALKAKIQIEAENLNFLKKESRLPL